LFLRLVSKIASGCAAIHHVKQPLRLLSFDVEVERKSIVAQGASSTSLLFLSPDSHSVSN